MENRTVATEAASGFLSVFFAYDLLSVIFVSVALLQVGCSRPGPEFVGSTSHQISVNRGRLPLWTGKAPLKIRYSGKNI